MGIFGRLFLAALALLGLWYVVPVKFPSVLNVIVVSQTLDNFPIRWLHLLTLVTLVIAFRGKSK